MTRHHKPVEIYFSPSRFCPDRQLMNLTDFQINIHFTTQHIYKPHKPSHDPKFVKKLFFLSHRKRLDNFFVVINSPKLNFNESINKIQIQTRT